MTATATRNGKKGKGKGKKQSKPRGGASIESIGEEPKAAPDAAEQANGSGEPAAMPKSETEADELLVKIEAAERKCRESDNELNAAKAELKMAKARHEYNVDKLRELCSVRINDADRPLFNQDASKNGEAWHAVPLADIGLGAGVVKALAENRIATMGDLASFTSDGHGRLGDLKGIGEKSAEQIQEVTDKWWQEHPEYLPAAAAEAPAVALEGGAHSDGPLEPEDDEDDDSELE